MVLAVIYRCRSLDFELDAAIGRASNRANFRASLVETSDAQKRMKLYEIHERRPRESADVWKSSPGEPRAATESLWIEDFSCEATDSRTVPRGLEIFKPVDIVARATTAIELANRFRISDTRVIRTRERDWMKNGGSYSQTAPRRVRRLTASSSAKIGIPASTPEERKLYPAKFTAERQD